MDVSDKPQHVEDYHLEQLDGEILLYHPNRTTILYCNNTASLVWQLCDGNRTVREITRLLSEAYEEPIDTIGKSIEMTLQHFAKHRAIEFV